MIIYVYDYSKLDPEDCADVQMFTSQDSLEEISELTGRSVDEIKNHIAMAKATEKDSIAYLRQGSLHSYKPVSTTHSCSCHVRDKRCDVCKSLGCVDTTQTQDEVLDRLFKNAPADTAWGYSFYMPRPDQPAELYLTTPDGQCWRIKAEKHDHPDEVEIDKEVSNVRS